MDIDPFKNFTPKANPVTVQAVQTDTAPLDLSSPDELRALAKGKLVEIIRTAPVNVSLVAAIRELLDRVDGKPMQSVNVDATVRQVTVNATIRYLPPRVDGGTIGGMLPPLVIDNNDKSNS